MTCNGTVADGQGSGDFAISHVLPATYYVELLQTLFLAGNVWPLILKDCAVLLLAATALLSLARVNTRKRLL